MASVLNRTTKEYLPSVNTPDYPTVDWIINPDVSALAGVPTKYWNISGDTVTEMTQPEKDAVDAAEQANFIAQARQALKDNYNQSIVSDKAIVLMLLDEINILRAALAEIKAEIKPNALTNALTYNTDNPRTPAQAKTAYDNKVDSL